ncbi:MAG: L,D-transpeptidase family protein [Porphyrobacter sp.]|nr:L,D-transpeptidase family protein [Porphyrobacter sp.]
MRNTLKLTLAAAAFTLATPLLAAQPKGDEPVAVPSNIKQGIDFVYVDPAMSTVAHRHQKPRNWLSRLFKGDERNAPNPVFTQLQNGLEQYRTTWGALPQVKIPAGPGLKIGATGKRVQLLRTRLGLPAGNGYDQQLAFTVANYQRVHGLAPSDGIAGKMTIASLNRGADYYERRIAINMERAWRLPSTRAFDRYVVIDSGAAMAYLFDRDRAADSMRVVVGSPKTKTPMMAVLMKDAKVHPYWIVPPDLIRTLTAKRIGEQGLSYLDSFHYEVLANWSPGAPVIDPKTVNWKQIASGKKEPTVLVRQLPGPWNSMGEMKFEMPNDYGIYLHDTPHKELFAEDERHLSNGCIRLSDYRRFADWVFGRMPTATSSREQLFPLPAPVPVYMTYLTVEPTANGVVFRPDVYGFDEMAMPQMFGGSNNIASASADKDRG